MPRAFLIWKAMHSAVATTLQTSVLACDCACNTTQKRVYKERGNEREKERGNQSERGRRSSELAVWCPCEDDYSHPVVPERLLSFVRWRPIQHTTLPQRLQTACSEGERPLLMEVHWNSYHGNRDKVQLTRQVYSDETRSVRLFALRQRKAQCTALRYM